MHRHGVVLIRKGKKLSSSCPDSTVLDGLAIRGNDAQNDQDSVRESVNAWISGLGYF